MPVMTRSCGRKEPRRRIEDPTPARICRTTAKRRKDVSDEENERPPKKKPSISDKSQAAPTTLCNKKNQGLKKSRIPQRCVSEKRPVKTIRRSYENADEDDNEVQFRADKRKNTGSSEARDEHCTAQETPLRSPVASRTRAYSALKRSYAGSSEARDEHCTAQETPLRSPVASRTRAFSALKRSYKRKKQNQADKKQEMETSLSSTSGDNVGDKTADSLNENEMERDVQFQVKEADSSTCSDGNERMEVRENGCVSSGGEGRNEGYYKDRFHEMVQKLKQMQEQFSQTHQNTHKNITAYDAFIKELKASLEQEKKKSATIEEELNQTREQLLMAQKEIENRKPTEQQDQSMSSTTCTSQGTSQNEEFSQLEDLEKAENSTLLGMIKFYAGLTGITLSSDSPTSNSELIKSYCCAYRPTAASQVLQFRLTHDKEFEEYEYSPNFQSPKNGTFLRKIPGYLKENMYFNTDQAQSFLVSLIKAVQKV